MFLSNPILGTHLLSMPWFLAEAMLQKQHQLQKKKKKKGSLAHSKAQRAVAEHARLAFWSNCSLRQLDAAAHTVDPFSEIQ